MPNERGTMSTEEALILLGQTTWRIAIAVQNDSGHGWRCGESYEKLVKVLTQYLGPQLDEQEGKEEAERVRRKCGVIAPYKG